MLFKQLKKIRFQEFRFLGNLKKFDFLGKFRFFTANFTQKIDFSEEISENFRLFSGNFTKKLDSPRQISEEFRFLGNFKKIRFYRKISIFYRQFHKKNQFFRANFRKISIFSSNFTKNSIFQGKFPKNFDFFK